MIILKRTLVILMAMGLCLSCRKEEDSIETEKEFITEIEGTVTDKNGSGVEMATIYVNGKEFDVDATGYFFIPSIKYYGQVVVVAKYEGKTLGSRTLINDEISHHFISFRENKNSSEQIINPLNDNVLVDPSNVLAFTIPKNSIIDERGQLVSNSVKTTIQYLNASDPSFDLNVKYGNIGTDENNNKYAVEIDAVFELGIVDMTNGAKLRLRGLQNKANISAGQGNPSQLKELFQYDESTGLWKPIGKTEFKNGIYQVTIPDAEKFCIGSRVGFRKNNLEFKSTENVKIPIQRYRIKTSSGGVVAFGFSNIMGQISPILPDNTNLIVEFINQCDEIVSTSPISTLSGSNQIIILPHVNIQKTLFGSIKDCNGRAVNVGKLFFYDGSKLLGISKPNANGDYQILLNSSCSSNIALTIGYSGTENGRNQQYYHRNITEPISNVDLLRCGIDIPIIEILFSNGEQLSLNRDLGLTQNNNGFSGYGNGNEGLAIALQETLKMGNNSIKTFNLIKNNFDGYETENGQIILTKAALNTGEFYEGKIILKNVSHFIGGNTQMGLTGNGSFKFKKN